MAHQGRKKADHHLVMALACGATVEHAARQAGVSESTVYRRLQDPAFYKQVDDARADTVKRFMSMLSAANLEAVKTLVELLKSSVANATRLGAARSIIELGGKLREQVDFEERLRTVEQQTESKQTSKTSRKT